MKIVRPQILILVAIFFAGFAFPVDAQDGLHLNGRDGDIFEARGSDAAARVRAADLCKQLHPGPLDSAIGRQRYPDWLKALICAYIVADFRTAPVRDAYIAGVLTALRAHSDGDWKIENGDSIIHIVTDQPAYLKPVAKGLLPTMVKTATLKRSLRDPSKAAFGMHASLFATPPLKAGVRRDDRDKRAAKAETVIQYILVYMLVADQLAGTKDALSKGAVLNHFHTGLTAFKSIMTEKAVPKIDKLKVFALTFGPRPAASSSNEAPPYKRPNLSIGKKVIELDVNPHDRPVEIAKLSKTRALGLTVPAPTLEPGTVKITPLLVEPHKLESIEPRPRFEAQITVSIAVRTRFAAVIYPGAVPNWKVKRDQGSQRYQATRVRDQGGWNGWKGLHRQDHGARAAPWRRSMGRVAEEGRGEYRKRYAETDVPNLLSKKITIDTQRIDKIGDSQSLQNLIVKAEYVFAKKHGSSVSKARSELTAKFRGSGLRKYSREFDEAYRAKGDAFHKQWKGIDENCEPTTDAGKAVVGYGSYAGK